MRKTRRGPMTTWIVASLFCGLWGASLPAGADDVRHAGAAAGATLAGNRSATPVEGQSSDIAPFAYAYRKGAANNPIETQWLSPQPDMLCGLLWEERRSVRRIEVEFPPAPATAPSAQQLRLVTRAAAAPFEEAVGPRIRPWPPAGVHAQANGRSGGDAAGHDAIHLCFQERYQQHQGALLRRRRQGRRPRGARLWSLIVEEAGHGGNRMGVPAGRGRPALGRPCRGV